MRATHDNAPSVVFFLKAVMAGGTAAGISRTLMAPIDRVRLLLEYQRLGAQQYNGFIDCLVKVVQQQGVKTLWFRNYRNVIQANTSMEFCNV